MSDTWGQQREAIYEAAWQGDDATCPDDGSVLNIDIHVMPSGPLVKAACPRCGKSLVMRREDDPKAATFRPWSDEEKKTLVDQYFAKKMLFCPVDGARLEPTSIGMLGVTGERVK